MRPYVRQISRLLGVILALLALAPNAGAAPLQRRGAMACQTGPAPSCCCPKDQSLSGNCCCAKNGKGDCGLGKAPCTADEVTQAVLTAERRAELPARVDVGREPMGFVAAPARVRSVPRECAANPQTPPPQTLPAS